MFNQIKPFMVIILALSGLALMVSSQVWAQGPKAQEIIYLRYFLELSEAETAAALKIAPGTAKSRLHRALKQLRAVIEADFPDLWITWDD